MSAAASAAFAPNAVQVAAVFTGDRDDHRLRRAEPRCRQHPARVDPQRGQIAPAPSPRTGRRRHGRSQTRPRRACAVRRRRSPRNLPARPGSRRWRGAPRRCGSRSSGGTNTSATSTPTQRTRGHGQPSSCVSRLDPRVGEDVELVGAPGRELRHDRPSSPAWNQCSVFGMIVYCSPGRSTISCQTVKTPSAGAARRGAAVGSPSV